MRRKQFHTDAEIEHAQACLRYATPKRYGHDSVDDMLTCIECVKGKCMAPRAADLSEIAKRHNCSNQLVQSRRDMGLNKFIEIIITINDAPTAIERLGKAMEISQEDAKQLVACAQYIIHMENRPRVASIDEIIRGDMEKKRIEMDKKSSISTHTAVINLRDYKVEGGALNIISTCNWLNEHGMRPNITMMSDLVMREIGESPTKFMEFAMVDPRNVIGWVTAIRTAEQTTGIDDQADSFFKDILIVDFEIDHRSTPLSSGDEIDELFKTAINFTIMDRPGDFVLKPRMIGDRFICFDYIYTGIYSKYTMVERKEYKTNET